METATSVENVELVPFELRVTSRVLPLVALSAVRRVYLRCVKRGDKLYYHGRPIADHGRPHFDYAERQVKRLGRAPLLGRLGVAI